VVSKPRIRPESKAQPDEKAQHTWEYVSISKRLATPSLSVRCFFEMACKNNRSQLPCLFDGKIIRSKMLNTPIGCNPNGKVKDMKYQIRRYVQLVIATALLTLASTPVWAQQPGSWTAPDKWFVYLVIIIVLFGSLVTLLVIRTALSASNWSLAKALSEEAEVTAMKTDASGNTKPRLDSSKKPVMITELCPSTSRLVAFMGMIVILLMFIGFGSFALYSFAVTGNMPNSIDKVVNFLLAGLTLFAPYAVNKFSSMFESLSPKKT